jgi:uncharacterized integral membrane protein
LGTCRPFQLETAGRGFLAAARRRCPVSQTDASRNNVSRKCQPQQCHRNNAGRTALMLGFVAAILFAIAFIINAANVSISNAIFSPTSLMLLGLVCLALHLSGVGTSWKYRR